MLVALVQVGIVIMGVEQSKKSNKNFWQACKAICIWGLLGTGSIFCCLGMQFLFFGLPYRGSLVAGLLSTFLFATCLIGFGYLVGKIIRDTVFATQTACVIVLPTSILGGYTYPLMSMPQSFQSIGNLIPFTHYGNAIRNLCLKEMSFTQLTPDIMILLGFLVAELLILFGIFCVEKNHETKISSFSEL